MDTPRDTQGVVRLGMPGNKKPEHKELGRFLVEYCTMWQTIGLHLKLKQALLNVIAGDHHSSQERFKETLHRWLQMDTEATWTTLELAITNANREKLSLGPLDAMPLGSDQPRSQVQPQPQAAQPQLDPSSIMMQKPHMGDLNDIVVPKVMNKWRQLAEGFRYDDEIIARIKNDGKNTEECCQEFFRDWLGTNNGKGKKTWSTLFEVITKIRIATDIIDDMKKKVLQLSVEN